MSSLFPALDPGSGRPALRFGDRSLTYGELSGAAGALAARLEGAERVAVWATPTLETAVAVVAALLAGVPAVPLNPRTGERELTHIVTDSRPTLVLAAPDDALPGPLADVARIDVTPDGDGPLPAGPGDPEAAALIVYTSGTTGPPKGAVLPRRAVATTLDALEDAWAWTGDDVLVHALPLFHVHGLILGVLGPLRRGGSVRHLGTFTTGGVARELAAGGTMLFGVPTMYHRIAEALEDDPQLAKALAGARLLVSGSAALPLHDHERIAALTGRRVIERYGMTETLMNTSVRADDVEPRTGSVGVPLPGVELRLVDEEDGTEITADDGETVGEIQVRGPNLFTGYLNRPDATAAAFDGTWFRTGDMAVRDTDGSVRIVGRRATDLIKSGGYKIGAGEIENALLEHPGVREAAVTGEPDADLGERIVAWVVPADPARPPSQEDLAGHVAAQLAPHKRPRTVRYLDVLPRNDMGKIMKRALHG
ncbi:acyl-CoA synthetase [Streptomyces sp. WAC05374]|uniref:acyl-CoA synthetase n=1 Tax=Streptomyces sp. WAC05374 TaxID=2487420 RepID=UPI000F885903|nr:acyl-CoA synthetase [Streptomyces sp. WAC05374]RST18088.1 acyl-CoA synthetase [Streptomyces sp. WAC05374]TDF45233.1 acyl-CoA synthetase [Streptomyces sp. WAC05374]TDF55779.1 acyl-CoA synthetase [Streptomyces sp. WAC05374]TDF58917.1 acyl-CoA synthetase [Streptomyces sp. WAC05374]